MTKEATSRDRRVSSAEIWLAVLGIVTVMAFFLVGQTSQKSLEDAVASERISSSIAYELTQSHVRLEEHLRNGSGPHSISKVTTPLDRSLRLCRLRLTGGATELGMVPQPAYRDAQRIRPLCDAIERFRLFITHVSDPKGTMERSSHEPAFDRALALADSEIDISADQVNELDQRINALRKISVSTISLLFVAGLMILRRHLEAIQRRSRDLQGAYDEVERARQQAKEFDRLRRDLVANISHELRTPLVPILGWSQLLSRSPSIDPPTVQEYSTAINRAAHRLSRVVDSLLQITQDHHAARASEVQVKAVSRAIAASIKSRGRKVEVSLDEGMTVISTDRKLLVAALAHITDNAIKFSPPDSPIELRITRRDGETVFTIIDQGPGFPAGPVKEFRLFVQGESGTTRTHGGMGTGLFLASAIAEELGGYIETANEDGKGASVSVVLDGRSHVA